jgi:polyisoprenoid-binding protein YceI
MHPILATVAALAQTPASPVTYTLDPERSWLFVTVYNDKSAVASALAHDHAIRAMDFDGTVVWDAADASACKVDIRFPVTVLEPDPPGARARAGLDPDGAVGPSSLQTIKSNFLGKSQLDAAAFPEIRYTATQCQGTTGAVTVTGNLTIHGKTVPVTTTLDVSADGSTFTAAGSFDANATAFGFKPFSNALGAVRNQDRMKFVIDVVGSRAQ